MKTINFLATVLIVLSTQLFAQINDSCIKSLQICSGYTYSYPLNTNTVAQNGPNYGCLYTQPNPGWFFIKVAQGGDFIFQIVSPTGNDIDFACWGPFIDPSTPCVADLTASCTPCPNNTTDPNFYPSGNLVDCSFDPANTETLHIYGAQPNQYYILIITNYSNQQGLVSFYQSNAGQPGAGVAECNNLADVSGKVYLDLDANNQFNAGDVPVQYAMIESPKCGFFYFMTDHNGLYNGYVCYTPDTIRAYYPYMLPYIQSVTPTSYTVNNHLTNADFAIVLEPNVCDVGIYLVQETLIGIWNNGVIDVILDNWGTTDLYVNLTVELDTNLTFLNATVPPTNITGNTIVWDSLYIPFLTYDILGITVAVSDTTISTNTPFMVSAVANTIGCSDADSVNNYYALHGVISTSYDPNYKEVNPSGEIAASQAANQQEFIYTIHFQNTGTAPAHNVIVVDTLSNWLNIPTLTLIGSSHPCTYEINEHSIIKFNFWGIDLPDSTSDPIGSNGYVMFKVKCLPSLANGGDVYNKAYIYFDSNPAVETNTVLTFVRNAQGIKPNIKPVVYEVNVIPNPVKDIFTVSSSYKLNKIEIYNSASQLVKSIAISNPMQSLTFSRANLDAGVYLIKAYTVNGKILRTKMIVE